MAPSFENTNAQDLIIKTFPVGPLGCNCTIVGHKGSGEAIVIDPGGDADEILLTLREYGLTRVRQILHTHAHFDHFLASGHVREATGAKLCLHRADEPLWNILDRQCAMFGIPFEPVPPPDHWLSHEEELPLTDVVQGQAIHTPGHSPGSMCFLFEAAGTLVSGDTLFRGGIGRTDLWGGDAQAIERSIKKRLYTLDEDLTVIPGHGPTTVLGHEMRHNSYVRAGK
jgi:glyoxylase-like metal-dependent hydrolase (beta-lactamase superfamily II)